MQRRSVNRYPRRKTGGDGEPAVPVEGMEATVPVEGTPVPEAPVPVPVEATVPVTVEATPAQLMEAPSEATAAEGMATGGRRTRRRKSRKLKSQKSFL